MNHRRPYYDRPSRWITVRGFAAEFVTFVGWSVLILVICYGATARG